MKRLLSIITLLFFSTICFAQSFHSFIVSIHEKGSGKPISNTSVRIKEAGWTEKITGNDGKVVFNKSIPVGEVNYLITKDGYDEVYERFNITTEEKSNTLIVYLTKTAPPSADKILIKGEVSDKNNTDIEGAEVEVKVANIVKSATTDRSGNYFIEVELGKTGYLDNMVRIEAKDRDCKKIETVYLPRTNVVNKDFVLECSNGNTGALQGGQDSEVNPAWRKSAGSSAAAVKSTISGVEITVDKCEVVGYKMICHLTYRNVGTAPSVLVKFGKKTSKLTDEKGNAYESSNQIIGNIAARYSSSIDDYELIHGSIVKGRIEFDLVDPKVKKIVRLQIGEGDKAHNIYNIPVTPN